MKFAKKEVRLSGFVLPLAMSLFTSFMAALREMVIQTLWNTTIEERINATVPIYNAYDLLAKASGIFITILVVVSALLLARAIINFMCDNELVPERRKEHRDDGGDNSDDGRK